MLKLVLQFSIVVKDRGELSGETRGGVIGIEVDEGSGGYGSIADPFNALGIVQG